MDLSGNGKEIDGLQLEMGSGEFGNSGWESSASDRISAGESNARKRKAKSKSSKITEVEGSNAKRYRSAENDEIKAEADEIAKPAEPPKQDFIHVRARRGQATDSHSLAERVRREKISERMKQLQGLVPGCNKVTGKALMLDEIINYVQSLQQQVEFLSMKLASMNPRLEFSMENEVMGNGGPASPRENHARSRKAKQRNQPRGARMLEDERRRSSFLQRSPKVDQDPIEVASAEVTAVEDPIMRSSSDSHTNQTNTSKCQAPDISSTLPDQPMEESVDPQHESGQCPPGFGASKMSVDAREEDVSFTLDIDKMEGAKVQRDSSPSQVSEENEHSVQNLREKK